jgi:hypothetical protein
VLIIKQYARPTLYRADVNYSNFLITVPKSLSVSVSVAYEHAHTSRAHTDNGGTNSGSASTDTSRSNVGSSLRRVVQSYRECVLRT